MTVFRSAWVLPIAAPPVHNGWVQVAGDRIARVGGPGQEPAGADVIDLGQVAMLPGLVNAHTHLELSHLRGAIPPSSSFIPWVRQVMASRRATPAPDDPSVLQAVAGAVREVGETGTALVGDISNTLVTFRALASSRLGAVVFHELIGGFSIREPDAFVEAALRRLEAHEPTASVRRSLAAHAPYSVAPSVFRAMRRVMASRSLAPCSVHLAESPEEVEFVASGSGPWRVLLEELGVWDDSFTAPGCSPVRYLDGLGFIDSQTLVVHGVQMSPDDLSVIARRGATLIACPRSNQYVGVGTPPLDSFYASGARIALGTDSLASVADLNMFSELAAMRRLTSSVPASTLLASATRDGAIALGFGGEFGEITPGARARLLAVTLEGKRACAADVEEYLVSGIGPERVRWVGEQA